MAAQYAVVAALFDAECLPDDAFACVASFWLGPRGYDAAPAPPEEEFKLPELSLPSFPNPFGGGAPPAREPVFADEEEVLRHPVHVGAVERRQSVLEHREVEVAQPRAQRRRRVVDQLRERTHAVAPPHPHPDLRARRQHAQRVIDHSKQQLAQLQKRAEVDAAFDGMCVRVARRARDPKKLVRRLLALMVVSCVLGSVASFAAASHWSDSITL